MRAARLLAGLALVLAAGCGTADGPQTVRPLVGAELVAALREGGHVLCL